MALRELSPRGKMEALLVPPSTRMTRKREWHSDESDVYHNDPECNTGNNIERENLQSGKGGNRLCKECKRLH